MRKLFSLIFGLAAVVGIETMFGQKPKMEIEVDPVSGRETLESLIRHKQNELRAR